MVDRVEGTGYDSSAPPRGELGYTKKQVTSPADLFAEEDDREDDDGHGDVENGPAARRQAWKLDYPEGGRDADTQGDDRRRPEDADEQTPSPPRVESDRRPDRTSLTARNREGDGERDRDHRNGNSDQRCDPGVRQCERNGERQPVRDAQVHDNLTQRTVRSRWRRRFSRSSLLHRFSSDSWRLFICRITRAERQRSDR
jgi:hypothetical protein